MSGEGKGKLPKPYYQDDYCTIYHGDCRDILPLLPKVDLVLTDPPYGIDMNTDYYTSRARGQNSRMDRNHAWHGKKHLPIFGDDEKFDPSQILLKAERYALFGANNYASKLDDTYSWIVWDKKTEAIPQNSFSDAELIYCFGADFNSVRIFRHMWSGYQRQSEQGEHLHPTQKPVELLKYIMGYFKTSQLILDPFMGSGTTLRAAKDLKRKSIGIEISEEYCAIAKSRLRQEVLI
jgi:DNA modification methylase